MEKYPDAIIDENLTFNQSHLMINNSDFKGVYWGQIKNGQRHGFGRAYILLDHDEYITEGFFLNNQSNFYYRLIFSDGSYYFGECKNDLKNGQGKYFDAITNITQEGTFTNDEF